MYTYIYIYPYLAIYVFISTCTNTHICIYIYIYIHIHIYIYMYVHIHTYILHIHIHIHVVHILPYSIMFWHCVGHVVFDIPLARLSGLIYVVELHTTLSGAATPPGNGYTRDTDA